MGNKKNKRRGGAKSKLVPTLSTIQDDPDNPQPVVVTPTAEDEEPALILLSSDDDDGQDDDEDDSEEIVCPAVYCESIQHFFETNPLELQLKWLPVDAVIEAITLLGKAPRTSRAHFPRRRKKAR